MNLDPVIMLNISSETTTNLFLQTDSGDTGLSNATAAKRLAQIKHSEKLEPRWKKELKLLFRQFTNPLVMLLVVAVLLSASLGENSDTLIILFILLSTGLIGFYQELKAGREVEKLQQMIRLTCKVIREGNVEVVNAADVVSGDLVLFKAGDVVPQDCRIIECNELHVNESALTGESFPVEKMTGTVAENAGISAKFNCLWRGTNVVSGTAKALVVNTGNDTLFGKVQNSLQTQSETAFEKGIRKFGYFILRVTIVLSVGILAINLYFERPMFDAVLFSLAVAVGMAPELLPAIMTFTMSAGAKRMMNKKVIVKKLSSIFNLGEVNVLCTDKTGTITEGLIRVNSVLNHKGESDDSLKIYAAINSGLQNGFDNPIDVAINEMGIDISAYKKLDELPYDFIRKRLSILVDGPEGKIMVTKGAFVNVLEVCATLGKDSTALTDGKRKELTDLFSGYGERGYRVIALSLKRVNTDKVSKDDEKDMAFSGFLLFVDPLKESAQSSIELLKKLNVHTKIITGDNRFIALHTAEQIGMQSPGILTGPELNDMSPEALKVKVLDTDVFAEIEPHQKERIVTSLRNAGKTVAYMGDGINDVAAIHAADIGLSVNDAVDVARDVADFVLLEKDLSVLADGILEGRKSFANSMKYILINTGATFGNMFSVAGASLLLPFLPMLPKQILMTNFLTDFPYLTVASDNVDDEVLESPGKWELGKIRKFMVWFGIHSAVFDFLTFFVLYFHFKLQDDDFRTGWFLESVLTELFILFIVRTSGPFFKSRPGKALMLSSALAFVITCLLPVSPLAEMLSLRIAHLKMVAALVLILFLYVVTADLLKAFLFRKMAVNGKK